MKRTETGGIESNTDEQKLQAKSSPIAQNFHLRQQVESGLRIVIARAEVLGCQLNIDLSLKERRSAHPAVGPHIACSRYTPDPWQPHWWISTEGIRDLIKGLIRVFLGQIGSTLFFTNLTNQAVSGFFGLLFSQNFLQSRSFLGAFGPVVLPLGVEAEVPTHRACFLSIPHYAVRLDGERTRKLDVTNVLKKLGVIGHPALKKYLEAHQGRIQFEFFIDGLVYVIEPETNRFTARLAIMVEPLEIEKILIVANILFQLFSGEEMREKIQDLIIEQFTDTGLGRMLQDCLELSERDRDKCLDVVVAFLLEMMECELIKILKKLKWRLVWMGIEG